MSHPLQISYPTPLASWTWHFHSPVLEFVGMPLHTNRASGLIRDGTESLKLGRRTIQPKSLTMKTSVKGYSRGKSPARHSQNQHLELISQGSGGTSRYLSLYKILLKSRTPKHEARFPKCVALQVVWKGVLSRFRRERQMLVGSPVEAGHQC